MAIYSDAENIQMNLPNNAAFLKNGMGQTVAVAIQSALDSTANGAGLPVWQRALAFLLRSIAADFAFQTFTIRDASYTNSKLLSLADYWDGQVPLDDVSPLSSEGFTSIPIACSWSSCDENSARCW